MREATAEEKARRESDLRDMSTAPDTAKMGIVDGEMRHPPSVGVVRRVSYRAAAEHIEFLNGQLREGVRWGWEPNSNALVAVLAPAQAAAFDRHVTAILKGPCDCGAWSDVKYPGSCAGC